MSRRNVQRIALCLFLAVVGPAAYAADEPKPPADATPAAPAEKAKRGVPEIMQDFQKESVSLGEVLSSPNALADEKKRTEAAPKVIPAMKKMVALLDELKLTGDPQGKLIADQVGPQLTTFLAVFGDKDTTERLEKEATSSDKEQSINAQGSLLMTHWIQSAKSAAAQEKVLDEARKLAKENPENEKLTQTLMAMGHIGAESPEISAKIQKVAVGMSTQAAAGMKEQVAHEEKIKSLENKPLTIEGVRLDGSRFSTADWKGKVIFVDFWATWCGPCRAELPRVKKAYADFHEKGLEVLGVSCDNEGSELTEFLQTNKDMPWPQLFDVKNPGWHPLAKSYGIDGIPTMFLIDRKGVLRSVTARENFEEMIPKLLEEKAE
jgi:thiol-disulfide isomerase/thioredoxin